MIRIMVNLNYVIFKFFIVIMVILRGNHENSNLQNILPKKNLQNKKQLILWKLKSSKTKYVIAIILTNIIVIIMFFIAIIMSLINDDNNNNTLLYILIALHVDKNTQFHKWI